LLGRGLRVLEKFLHDPDFPYTIGRLDLRRKYDTQRDRRFRDIDHPHRW